ncbi:DNA ligase 1-like isoform X2 [Saccostrea echinata]|uniref:DNA ligase 1-like isoform X2 n=1 Tax=Saccostrea echinata TaxID=191078 RepID=UPI002A827D8F|nr:DNA ligase 1-like isoform X2 [Saccostrea echinata]
MIKKHEITSKPVSGDVIMQPGVVPSSIETQPYQETFDTSLLVGPVYESNTNRKKAVIKQELSDITKRLHQTLYTYDTLDEYSAEAASNDSYVAKVRERINGLESKEMRDQLNVFVGRYEEMSTSVATANKERDDLLLELADWFTADHTDIEGSSAVSEKEERELSKSYAETVATFEKLKRIQQQMTADPSKKNKILAEEKRQVGRKVFDNIQLMKTISIQTLKISADTADFSPWKDAADEIVGMMKKVREESSEETKALSSKVYQLLSELEKQQQIIKRLNKEIKREKIVKGQLADDCTDLKVQLVQATETVKRYEEDLEKAKKFIEKQLKEMEKRKRKEENEEEEEEEESDEEEDSKQKLSSIMEELTGRDDGPKEMPSDPFILRTRIRQQEDTIEALKKELKETDLKVREFEPRLEAKDATLTELENENKNLCAKVDELNADLVAKENEIKKLAAAVKKASSRPPPPCKKCSRVKPAGIPEKKVPVDEIKDTNTADQIKAKDAEIEKLTNAIQQFKKLLAETEMKLSEAYREISDLRLLQSEHIFPDQKHIEMEPKLPSSQQSLVTELRQEVEMEEVESVQEVAPMQVQEIQKVEPTKFPSEEEAPVEQEEEDTEVEDLDEEEEAHVEIKQETVLAEKPIKPKTAVLAVEKQKTQPKRPSRKEKTKLPSLVRAPTRFTRQEPTYTEQPVDHEDISQREKVLFQVGDLQSRMNVILNMVADFVSSVSGMIYKEPKETKANGVRPFEFGGIADISRKKEVDPKKEESKRRRAQVMFCGQKISSLLREVYDLLSTTLNLQHNDFEMIYRSFKKHQKKRAMEQAIMSGSLQKYYGSGGRNTSYDYHRLHRTGSSLSAEDLDCKWIENI